MKVRAANFVENDLNRDPEKFYFFNEGVADKKVFKVADLQRAYTWQSKNLFGIKEDIERWKDGLSTDLPDFLLLDNSNSKSVFKEYIIYDGQQRLTTLILTLMALNEAYIRKNSNNDIFDLFAKLVPSPVSGDEVDNSSGFLGTVNYNKKNSGYDKNIILNLWNKKANEELENLMFRPFSYVPPSIVVDKNDLSPEMNIRRNYLELLNIFNDCSVNELETIIHTLLYKVDFSAAIYDGNSKDEISEIANSYLKRNVSGETMSDADVVRYKIVMNNRDKDHKNNSSIAKDWKDIFETKEWLAEKNNNSILESYMKILAASYLKSDLSADALTLMNNWIKLEDSRSIFDKMISNIDCFRVLWNGLNSKSYRDLLSINYLNNKKDWKLQQAGIILSMNQAGQNIFPLIMRLYRDSLNSDDFEFYIDLIIKRFFYSWIANDTGGLKFSRDIGVILLKKFPEKLNRSSFQTLISQYKTSDNDFWGDEDRFVQKIINKNFPNSSSDVLIECLGYVLNCEKVFLGRSSKQRVSYKKNEDNITREHILPQTPIDSSLIGSVEYEDMISKLGNSIFLRSSVNSKLQNIGIDDKIVFYRDEFRDNDFLGSQFGNRVVEIYDGNGSFGKDEIDLLTLELGKRMAKQLTCPTPYVAKNKSFEPYNRILDTDFSLLKAKNKNGDFLDANFDSQGNVFVNSNISCTVEQLVMNLGYSKKYNK